MNINKKALLKAFGFLFLPTAILLVVLLIITFDFQLFVSLLLGKSAGAYVLRIVLLTAEIVLAYFMYRKYLKEEVFKNAKLEHNTYIQSFKALSDPYLYRVLNCDTDKDISVYTTDDPSIRLIKISNR